MKIRSIPQASRTAPSDSPALSAPSPDPPLRDESPISGVAARRGWIIAGGAAAYATLFVLFLFGALRQSNVVNTDPHRTDQSAFLGFAERIVESGWKYGGQRNRMPAYPYLIAPLYDADDSLAAFFGKSKIFSIGLTVVLLHLIGLVAWFSIGPLAGSVTTLIVAFTVFIYRAPFVQAEVLFYTLFFLAVAGACRLLSRPGIGLACVTGVLFALAQLTKASALPALLLLVVCLGIRSIEARIGGLAPDNGKQAVGPSLPLASAITVLAVFLLVLSPYLINSKRTYGRYFYNVNSTFYVWYDSWEEAKTGTRAHGDRTGWPDMDPAEIPSARKYIREHGPAEIANRIRQGAVEIHDYLWRRHGFMKYGVILGVAAVLAFGSDQLRRPRAPIKAFSTMTFAVGILAGYGLLACWVYPLGPGSRVFMTIVLPALYFFQVLLQRSPSATATFHIGGRETCFRDLLNLVVLFCILSEIYPVLAQRVVRIYGGY